MASARIAAHNGVFSGYPENRDPFLKVMRKHKSHADALEAGSVPADLLAASRGEPGFIRRQALRTLQAHLTNRAHGRRGSLPDAP